MRSSHNLEEAGVRQISDPVEMVVADTSSLNYLIQIGLDFLLPSLYRRVIVPPVVISELSHSKSPLAVAEWAFHLPRWLEVVPLTTTPDEKLFRLDAGERDAIQLALEVHASEILIDERKGRKEANSRGLVVVGTLGVLQEGHQVGLIDAYSGLARLTQETTFRYLRNYEQISWPH